MNIKKKECGDEIVHCNSLFLDQLNYLGKELARTGGQKIDKTLYKGVLSLANLIGACAQENVSQLAEEAKARIQNLSVEAEDEIVASKLMEKFIIKSPYERIRLFASLFGDDYKVKLRDTLTMSSDEIHKYLMQEIDWSKLRGRFKNGEFS